MESPIANGIKTLNKELLMWIDDEESRKQENDGKARATAEDITSAESGSGACPQNRFAWKCHVQLCLHFDPFSLACNCTRLIDFRIHQSLSCSLREGSFPYRTGHAAYACCGRYKEMLNNYAKSMRGVRDRARSYKTKGSDLLAKYMVTSQKTQKRK